MATTYELPEPYETSAMFGAGGSDEKQTLGLGLDVGADPFVLRRAPRSGQAVLPSLPTMDRIVVNDVLEQYSPPKPGEPWDDSEESDRQQENHTYTPLSAASAPSAEPPRDMARPEAADEHKTQSPPLVPAPALATGDIPGHAPPVTQQAAAPAAPAAPPQAAGATHSTEAPKDAPHVKHKNSKVLAAERVENLVDQLLQEELLVNPLTRSDSAYLGEMLGATKANERKGPRTGAAPRVVASDAKLPKPAPALDLPTLPSWNPISLDMDLDVPSEPERPQKTTRPHISRDAVRERLARRQGASKAEQPQAVPVPAETESPLERVGAHERPAPSSAALPRAPASADIERQATWFRSDESIANIRSGPPRVTPEERAAQIIARKRSKRRVEQRVASPLPVHCKPAPPASSQAAPQIPEEPRTLEKVDEDAEHAEAPAAAPAAPAAATAPAATATAATAAPAPAAEPKSAAQAESAPKSAAEAPAAAPAAPSPGAPTSAFGNLMEREIARICEESDQPYRMRNRGSFHGATDSAGPAASSRVWQRVSDNDMMGDYAIPPSTAQTTGRVFVMVDSFMPLDIPVPRQHTDFYCILDNGIHMVKTGMAPLNPNRQKICPVNQEFELVEHQNLEFSLTLMVKLDDHLVEKHEAPPPPPQMPSETSGVSRFFKQRMNPKNAQTQNVRLLGKSHVPPLLMYVNRIGTLGRASVRFDDVRAKCLGWQLVLDVPVAPVGEGAAASQTMGGLPRMSAERARGFMAHLGAPRGTLRLRMFYLPPLPASLERELPTSLMEGSQAMERAKLDSEAEVTSGVLTQLGGDCRTWRRRPVRLVGSNLVCFNEVTKRPTIRIDLMQAVHIEDTNVHTPADEDVDETYSVENSFRITFRDGEHISFFADSEDSKQVWMRVLSGTMSYRAQPAPRWTRAVQRYIQAHSGEAPAPRHEASTATVHHSTSTPRIPAGATRRVPPPAVPQPAAPAAAAPAAAAPQLPPKVDAQPAARQPVPRKSTGPLTAVNAPPQAPAPAPAAAAPAADAPAAAAPQEPTQAPSMPSVAPAPGSPAPPHVTTTTPRMPPSTTPAPAQMPFPNTPTTEPATTPAIPQAEQEAPQQSAGPKRRNLFSRATRALGNPPWAPFKQRR